MLVRFIIIVLIIIIGILWYRNYKRSVRISNMRAQGAGYDPAFDPYDILQVPRDATQEEIRKAWIELAAQYHPDKAAHLGPDLQELAEKRFKEIQRAYEVLKRD